MTSVEPHTSSAGPVVFDRLYIEAFRGFNTPVEIDLSASVVIIHGPNGMGKTSLFDALQWVLLGELPRLRTARLKPSQEYIVNAYRTGERATVRVEMQLRGEPVQLSRTGDRNGSLLTWMSHDEILRGEPAEAALAEGFGAGPELDLASALHACGLLQQDAAREVLASKPRDRFDTFSELLGLGELAAVEQWAKTRAAAASAQAKAVEEEAFEVERRVAQTTARLEELRSNAAARPVVQDVLARLETELRSGELSVTRPVESRDAAVALVAEAGALAHDSATLASELRRLEVLVASSPPVDREALEQVQRLRAESEVAAAVARDQLALAVQRLARRREAQESLARMASAVLPHVTGDACPVCGQQIDPEDVRGRLSAIAGELSTAELEAEVSDIQRRLEAAEESLASAQRAEDALVTQLTTAAECQAQLEAAIARMGAIRARGDMLQVPELLRVPRESYLGLESLAERLSAVASFGRELVSAWDASAPAEEARAVTDAERARQLAESIAARREALSRVSHHATTLYEAVRRARVDVVRGEFARLSPLAQDIYSRLDPHPTFQDIDLVSELFRSVGTTTAQVTDAVAGVSADPMLVFSSAQANIAAISYLMSLNVASSIGAPVLLLDDPVQAMDDVNVLGFADLCRHVRQRRQLILSTHERRFAHLLERKLAPRREGDRTVVIEFVGWDRSGPALKTSDVPDQLGQLAAMFVS